LTLSTVIDKNRGEITSLAYSPDGQYIAAADAQRSVFVYEAKTKEVCNSSDFLAEN
jgi:WD40 repeat protein